MQLTMSIPRFHPQAGPTLLAGALMTAFVALGNWQLERGQAKEALQAALETQRRQAALALPVAIVADPAAWHLRPVRVRGEYEAGGQILIDNRVLHNRAGFHVLTPLRIAGSATRVLVNRGWIAAPADRRQTPAIAVPAGEWAISGTATVPSRRRFALAPETAAAGGNGLWQNLDLARYRSLSRHPVQPLVVLLSPESDAGGFDRDWPRLDASHERHRGYAFQWYALAVATLAAWLYFSCRRAPRP